MPRLSKVFFIAASLIVAGGQIEKTYANAEINEKTVTPFSTEGGGVLSKKMCDAVSPEGKLLRFPCDQSPSPKVVCALITPEGKIAFYEDVFPCNKPK
ncbi:MAG: hypothetical protein JKX75_03910 [Gammaproteobacteria bacterium]|nr:hypothetical protein [Gammaproteobacteria bacterium]